MTEALSEITKEQPTARRLEAVLPISYPTYVDRWAIVVGISQYKDQRLNLKYADRDAEELFKLIQTPSGGGFETDHIIKLTNSEATTAKITRALRSFLKKPAGEDIVLIYFACHGAPDLDRPGIVYLLTHDTDPTDISGTALPMREIDMSLKENLLAERVIIIADTCHSAAIGAGIGRRNTVDTTKVVNRYLKEVSEARRGIALLTSAENDEVSFEDAKWGGGHGVFTYYLLEGMRGAADYKPRNGVVTVGELFEYVRENVQRATGNQQHPCIGTNSYDRNLPIAITAGISAREHYELGYQLYQLGLLLDDQHCFESASRHLKEAVRFAEGGYPEASLQLGLSLMVAGKLSQAIKEFNAAMKLNTLPDAAYYLGIAYAKHREYEKAVQTLESFLSQQPNDDKVAWVRELATWVAGQATVTRHALLIGISEYSDSKIHSLRGPINDVEKMSQVLREKYVFNITTLTDAAATRQGIIDAFHQLQQKVKPDDVVVIYYSGHAITRDSGHSWCVYDSVYGQPGIDNTIVGEELHHLLNHIPTRHQTVIIDADPPDKDFLELVKREASYTLILSASPHQKALEVMAENGLHHGAFTYALIQQLSRSPLDVTLGRIMGKVVEEVQDQYPRQTPLLIGSSAQSLFAGLDYYLTLFDLSLRRNYSALTGDELRQRYADVLEQLTTTPFPQLHYSYGRAFLEKGNYIQALHALQTAIQQSKQKYPDFIFALGIAQLRTRLYHDAIASFQQYQVASQQYLSASDSSIFPDQLREIETEIAQLKNSRRYALLVGINNYSNPKIPAVQGAVNDVLALKRILVDKYAFSETDIKLLLNGDATREAIIEAFKELVENARENPALFYFAGNGSSTTEDTPTIVSVDGRQPNINDIELEELGRCVGNASTNLITIIDAGWNDNDNSKRYLSEKTQPQPLTRTIVPLKRKRELANALRIGCLSIYHESIQVVYSDDRGISVEAEFSVFSENKEQTIYGALTYALIRSLQEADPDTLTYRQWIDAVLHKQIESSTPFVMGENLDEIVFSNSVKEGILQKRLDKIAQEPPIRQAISILRRLIEQRNDVDPAGYLDLGIAYAVLGDYNKSIAAIDRSLAQQGEQDYLNANYWLGRVLFESKLDLARAVSALRQATQSKPDNGPAYYYLGLAIRELVERETLVEAENALQNYLAAGAPLGQEEQVQQFLRSRKKTGKMQ